MGATYGLGIAAHTVEIDAPPEDALAVLRAIAAYTGAPVRDALDDEVVEIAPDGGVMTLDGARADAIREAVAELGGSAGYAVFKYLDGFDVLVPGAVRGGEVEVTTGDHTLGLAVAPIAALRAHLDGLLASADVEPVCQSLHHELRGLCDDAERLGVPLVLSS